NLATMHKERKSDLHRTSVIWAEAHMGRSGPRWPWTECVLLAAAQALEPGGSLRVELVRKPAGDLIAMDGRLEVTQKGLRRELRHLPTGRPEHGGVARHEQHALVLAMLGSEALEQVVGVRRVADREG